MKNQDKVKVGFVYKNSDGEYFTPAQSGNFWIVDMWKCSKDGEVSDIIKNPCPVPVNTSDLKEIGKSKYKYEYPDFNPRF
jgi:hypothetical protein